MTFVADLTSPGEPGSADGAVREPVQGSLAEVGLLGRTAKLQEQLLREKERRECSWGTLASETGVPTGTLSQWAAGKYQGNNDRVADQVEKYFSGRAVQDELARRQVADPGFLLTPTSAELLALLAYAQSGEIVAAAMNPGIGKTTTALEHQRRAPNVWVATIAPSSRGVNTLQEVVLEAMGEADARGTPRALTKRIIDRLKGSKGLLVIDEAQELTDQALDEIKGWHDRTGVGIALLGDERVVARMVGGPRAKQLARLNSRVGMRLVQSKPKTADAEIVAHGWGIAEPEQLRFCRELSAKPGGLRAVVRVIKLAAMIATGEGRSLSIDDLRSAWAQLRSDITPAG